jgi:PAS domain S-box-containing protein
VRLRASRRKHNERLADDLDATRRLQDSEERYRTLISQVKDFAIFSTDKQGVVTTWNEGCQHVLGYTQDAFVGLHVAQLCTTEDSDECLPAAELRRAAESGTSSIERWMLAHGDRRFFAMGAATGLRDAGGRLTGFSVVLRDVTAMKLSQDRLVQQEEQLERLVTERTDQLQRTTERLRLSERMASLGTLAAGLGHDIGNLLLPLDVRLKVLLDAELDPDVRELVVGIQTCTCFFQQLSQGLRLMAADPLAGRTRTATELRRWWNDVGMIMKCVLPRGVRMEQQLPAGECWVAMGRAALTQAVFNLVQNAADALRERGYGRVTIGVEEIPDTTMVAMRVADDGPGMTEDVLRHCMEPSFSTKARSASSGLGLAFVQGLVSRAEGRVEIESTLGRGTSVSLILPGAVLEEQIEDVSVRAPPPLRDGGM